MRINNYYVVIIISIITYFSVQFTASVANAQNYADNNITPESLTYKSWREPNSNGTGYYDYVRTADGMITRTAFFKCNCYNGICNVCGGTGACGFMACLACRGSRRCQFCNGSGTCTSKPVTYRYIDEYYINNEGTALHVTSSEYGVSVTLDDGSKPISVARWIPENDTENYYAIKMPFMDWKVLLSKDYKTFIVYKLTYKITDKKTFEKAEQRAKAQKKSGVSGYAGGGGYVGGNNSIDRSSEGSRYTKCSSCNGSGICSSCNGKRGKWENTGYYTGDGSRSWINCGSCNGSGKCPICYGKGKF